MVALIKNKKLHALALVTLVLFVCGYIAYAINQLSEGHRLNTSPQTISGYNTCYIAKTTSGSNVFFPTKTAAEWNAFIAHKPGNVTLNACPPPCSGVSYGGYCWYLGTGVLGDGQSCTEACASHGGADISGTRDYVGSGGTLSQCSAVINALGYTPKYTQNLSGGDAHVGCYLSGVRTGFYGASRSTNGVTTNEAPAPGQAPNRVCACNN